MSLPPIGASISVTSTAENGEIGKFFGTYSPENDQFVLRPLPGKRYIQQFPMFMDQGFGWDYEINYGLYKEVDPLQYPVDLWGYDRMEFLPGTFTWALHESFDRTDNQDEILSDIDKVNSQNFSFSQNFSTLIYRKNAEVIKALVRKYPRSLKIIDDRNGLTYELLHELMEENGTWLEYVHNEYKTRDICLAAIRQTFKAFKFIPQKIKDDNPIFYEIAIEHNPRFIDDVPVQVVTEEMIRTALTKNPNVSDLPSMKLHLSKLPDYKDVTIPPSLKRQLSATQTNQGNQGVCGRHAFSRVIVKNLFELILPLEADREQEYDCNRFLATAALVPTAQNFKVINLSELNPKDCSFSGYIKILLFLHCFFLFQQHISTVEGRSKGWLECIQVSSLYEHLYTSIEIPNITHTQYHDLNDTLHTLERVQQKYGISLVTFHFKDVTLENIKKITDRGLYLMLRIEDSSNPEDTHAAHFVIIVGAFDEYMLVKNSWGDDRIYTIKFGYPFFLKFKTYDVLTDCSFVIPVQQPDNEDFEDLTHVDFYLQKYDELKTLFHGITVNVINKSCPSKYEEPVECDTTNSFRQQSTIFHPDKNPRCRKDAEAKFKKLGELCKTIERHTSQRLIGSGTRKTKGKQSRKKHRPKKGTRRHNSEM